MQCKIHKLQDWTLIHQGHERVNSYYLVPKWRPEKPRQQGSAWNISDSAGLGRVMSRPAIDTPEFAGSIHSPGLSPTAVNASEG
jgi:hypothetical protein